MPLCGIENPNKSLAIAELLRRLPDCGVEVVPCDDIGAVGVADTTEVIVLTVVDATRSSTIDMAGYCTTF